MNLPAKTKCVLAVCTRNRPEMLSHCLTSIMGQHVPMGIDLQVAVIDNSEDVVMRRRNLDIIDSLAGQVPVIVLDEPRPGISFARNRAVEHALAVRADSLVFLDDDQTIPRDWLTVVARVAEEETADAVKSGVTFVFEGEAKYAEHFTRQNQCLPKRDRQTDIRYVATNGVWISTRLFRELGLRFDVGLTYMGGEDTEFFRQAHERGAILVATNEVFAQEIVPRDKQSLQWLTKRNFRGGVCRAKLNLNAKGRVYYVTSGLARAFFNGALALILVWKQRSSTRNYLRAVQAAGLVWGALGGKFVEYKRVVGR